MKKVYILFKDVDYEPNCCEVVAVYDNLTDCIKHYDLLMHGYDSFFDSEYYYYDSYEVIKKVG